jgi:hypothetical protein
MDEDQVVVANFGADIELNIKAFYNANNYSESASMLLDSILEAFVASKYGEAYIDGYAFYSPAQRLRNSIIADDPYYDDDDDDSTPEMLMDEGLVQFLDLIAENLYDGEDPWEELSFAAKCEWIQQYTGP